MYTTILLDADMTIWDFEASEKYALRDVVTGLGVAMTDEIMQHYQEVNAALWHAFDLKQVTREELKAQRFMDLLKFVGKEADAAELNQKYQERLGSYSIMLPGAEEMCKTLAEHGTLYILTNGMHTAQTGRFNQSPIKPYIKEMFISEDMGCQKPDKEYYDQVFAAIGLTDKTQAVMVGDSLTSDIQGGINGGIDTIWYNPNHKPTNPQIMPTHIAYTMDEIVNLIVS